MSQDELATFLSEISGSQELQDELRSMSVGSGDEARIAPEDLVKFAATKGHDFTIQEIHSAFELSDDELESVSGGGGYMKLGDIKGESMLARHEKWIELVSFSSPVFRSRWKK